tara:strand:- start:14 stop:796 length:783 start_codon:yes stop_codon:yes gene_type:complete
MSGNMTTQKPDKITKDDFTTIYANELFKQAKIENDALPEADRKTDQKLLVEAMGQAKVTVTQEFIDNNLVTNKLINVENEIPLDKLDLKKASQRDIKGAFKGSVNYLQSLFGGKVEFQDQVKAGAQLEIINNAIKVPLVKALSDRGAKYTQESIEKMLPGTLNSDAENYSRVEALIPIMKNKIIKANIVVNNSESLYPRDKKAASKAKSVALEVINQLQQIIPVLEESLLDFDAPTTKNPYKELTQEEFDAIDINNLKED